MSLLTKADFKTHVYAEIIAEISRADDTIVQLAIDAGESQAKSYLNRYDLTKMFDPTFTDEFFRGLVKDLVCWRFIKLANPNIQLELFSKAYDDAIAEFNRINKGITQPVWPLKQDDPDTPNDDAGTIEYTSECKRRNSF